ncbi:PEP-CTERM system histidine kinase PrsK [Sphingomonas sp. A2-49]|uniref:XrtA/PEP-CTERM system histidine kinase PrsK n=1 Tax=Sphingomonas sp. A2-49 TaxID=1391375 RepID=UPI0021D2C2B0|nr:XrtA/PEP-CTERM system histidine kinase PrsK [Sphingomonas sp. A2-49]MCU6455904.1 PEP-CTERM system histidine kinase PrsK [Sphingomonas sp. A2-49]
MAALILWGHALAALAFGALALAAWQRPIAGTVRGPLAAALVATALWALAVAGIGIADIVPRLAESVRNLAWLGLMLIVVRRGPTGGLSLYAVYATAATMTVFATALALVETLPLGAAAIQAVAPFRLVARMLAAVAGLVLVHQLAVAGPDRNRGRIALLAAAIATMWGTDLVAALAGWSLGTRPLAILATRGFLMTGAALLLLLATRRGDRALTVSHGVALRLTSVAAVIAYAGLTIAMTQVAERYAGDTVRIVQTAIVLGATTALVTLLSTPWLRAWTKVKVAKHFFRHRYDYRAEWQRFTATLGSPGEGADPLDRRIIRAIADLTGSPAGLLLVPEGVGLGAGAAWHWPEAGGSDAALPAHLAASARIVELDQVRRGEAPAGEAAAIPRWMRDAPDAWALVPLIHGTSLIGAILLGRPPVDRPLDWEDLDLLRVAGRQAASYLAEDRAHAALADAARFDEFNRRFAFIIHDIKNLVSGVSLVARNAERHADNPAFRADMIATLKDSAARMNALLARLSQHHRATPEPLQPVDVAALALRLAATRRAQHPIAVTGEGIARAQPGRLEQLLGHLLQNAIEASPDGAPIAIHVAAGDGHVHLDVIDHGCGMSAAFVREQLFRPFASSKPDGFGIGAYESRALAEDMGGTLAVASREGEGTRFRLTLRAAQALEQAA